MPPSVLDILKLKKGEMYITSVFDHAVIISMTSLIVNTTVYWIIVVSCHMVVLSDILNY